MPERFPDSHSATAATGRTRAPQPTARSTGRQPGTVDGSAEYYRLDSDSATVAARKSAILDAAAARFAVGGVAGTSVRDIAAASGVKSGALYNYFESKEEMVVTIVSAFLGELSDDTANAAHRPGTYSDRFEALVHVAVEAMVRRRDACLLYQNEVMYLQRDPAYGALAGLATRIRQIWLDVLAGGAAAGEFRTDLEPEHMYRLTRDGVWSAVRWFRPGSTLSPAGLANSYASILLGGIRLN